MDDASRLRAKAQDILERTDFAGLVPDWPVGVGTVLRFYPSFHQWQVWAFVRRAEFYHLAALRWDLGEDLRRLLHEPDVGVAKALLPVAALAQLDDDLGRIVVHIFEPSARVGCDGATFAIERHGYFQHGTVGWWCNPPPTWHALGRWFADAVAVFDQHLPPTFAALFGYYVDPPRPS